MNNFKNREFTGRLIISVLTEQLNVREAIKNFPESEDRNIECAYHALVHYAADEDLRRTDIEYREAQDDYLESIAQALLQGKDLPKNIIEEYKPYYKGIAHLWKEDALSIWREFKRFINL